MNPSSQAEIEELLSQREWLRRLARRLLGEGPDADDLVQETLTRALTSRAPRPWSRGWLATVAKNLFFESRRSAEHRRARESASARPEAVGGDAALERAALRRALLDEVLRLDEPERTAVVLRYLEGLPYPEVAARQRTSVVAARKRVSRAIERLRARLDEWEGGRGAWVPLLAPWAGLDSAASVAAAASSSSSTIAGILAMSSKLKLILIGVLLVVLVAVVRYGPFATSVGPVEPDSAGEDAASASAIESLAGDDLEREPAGAGEANPDPALPTPLRAFALRPAAEVGSLELHARWSDGTPAEGVSAQIVPWGAEDPHLHLREVRTDHSGSASIDQLAPGRVGIYADRGGSWVAQIVAGSATIKEIRIPVGVTLRGRVLDPEGGTVAGATVYLSSHGNTEEGCPVATSDVAGEFEVRDVSDQRYLSARAPGYAPSDQVYAKGTEGSEIRLDLVLRGPGGAVAGVVFAPDGRAVMGARVVLTGLIPEGWQTPDDGRWREESPLPIALRTEGEGRFFSDRIGAGPVRVQVRTEEFVPWDQSVSVRPAGLTEVEIQLEEGATLVGVVRHADGTPATEASVYSGGYGDFGSYAARCGADGHYRMRGLRPGLIELRASERRRGRVTTKLTLVRGEVGRWDATLVEGLYVRGRVVDERGSPLPRWQVGVSEGRGLWTAMQATDQDGAFELTDAWSGSTDLVVGPPDLRVGIALVLRNALPAEDPLHIEVPDALRHGSSARLRVLIDGEPAGGDTQVVVQSRAPFSYREFYPDDEGRVEVGRLRAGDYRLSISAPGRAQRHIAFDVGVDEDEDLGDVSLGHGGRVHLILEGDDVEQLLQAVVIDDTGAALDFFDVTDGHGESGLLAAGDFHLRIVGDRLATQILHGVIEEGLTVELRARVRPGTKRHVAVSTADGTPILRETVVWVHDARGRLVQRFDLHGGWSGQRSEARHCLWGLELGRYHIVVEGPHGRRGEGEVQVTTLEPVDEDAAEIVLR